MAIHQSMTIKIKVEKHLSLSVCDCNILCINVLYFFGADRCSENGAKDSSYDIRIPCSYGIRIPCSYDIRIGCSYDIRIGCSNGIKIAIVDE